MSKRSKLLVMAALFTAACCPAAAPNSPVPASDGSLPGLAWLAGSWATDDGSTEEHWTAPRGGSMMGAGRTVKGDKTVGYEHLRIAGKDGQIAYHAMPVGQPPATFKLVEKTDRKLVFADPEHDYPQRVIYEKITDDHLVARIEGTKNGKSDSSSWSLRRVRGGAW